MCYGSSFQVERKYRIRTTQIRLFLLNESQPNVRTYIIAKYLFALILPQHNITEWPSLATNRYGTFISMSKRINILFWNTHHSLLAIRFYFSIGSNENDIIGDRQLRISNSLSFSGQINAFCAYFFASMSLWLNASVFQVNISSSRL